MSYTVYSNADVDMMENVFNAIAAWANSFGVVDLGPTAGSAIVPYQVFITGLAIGIITAMVQSLMKGAQNIEIGPIFVSMILFLCMFVPKDTVIIQSNQTGEMRVVANVPIGAAIPGWFFSSLGNYFAEQTETLFGMPAGTGVTDQGFGQTLMFYSELEKARTTDRLFSVFNKMIGGAAENKIDSFASIKNYIKDCSLADKEINRMQPGSILATTVEDLKYDSTSSSTELFLDTTGPQIYDCSAGWAKLDSTIFSKFTSPQIMVVLQDIFSISQSAAAAGKSPITEASKNNAALGFNVDVNNLFSASILRPATFASLAENEATMGNTAGAMAIEMNYHSGRITQETSMIGKGYAWRDMMLHLMTFAEVIFYGVLPIMSLFVASGTLGLKSFSKFMVLGIWINMWAPMIALVDFYIDFQAIDMMQSVNATLDGSGSLSISQLAAAAEVTQKALATGYSFMPMIPILSLFILTGSMMAATRVFDGSGQASGAMGAAAALSPKNEAFGARSDGKGGFAARDSMMGAESGYHAHDSVGSKDGHVKAGLSLPEIGFGNSVNQSHEQASARSAEASETLNGSMNQAWQSAQQNGTASRLEQNLGQGLTSKSGENFKWAESLKSDLMESSGLSSEQAEQVVGKMSAGISAGAGGASSVLGSKLGADLTANMSDSEKAAFNSSLSQAETQATEASKNEGYEADYGSRFGEATSATFADTESSTLGHTISDQASDVRKASESEKKAETAMEGVKSDNGLSVGELMEPESMAKMQGVIGGLDDEQLQEFKERKADHFETAGLKSDDEATKNAWSTARALMDVDHVGLANALVGGNMDEGHGRDDSLNVEDASPIRSPDDVAPNAGTPVTDETEEHRPDLVQQHQEDGAEARKRYEDQSGDLQGDAEDQIYGDRVENLAGQMEDRQGMLSESDRALSVLDGDSLGAFKDLVVGEAGARLDGVNGAMDQIASAYEDGGGSVFDATVAAMGLAFGDGMADIVDASRDDNFDTMVGNIHSAFVDQAPEEWTDAQQELYANHGTAKVLSDMAGIQDTLADNLAGAAQYTLGGQFLDSDDFKEALGSSDALLERAQEFSGEAGHSFADVQKEANASGFGDTGPALINEIQLSAAKSSPSELVTQYNGAMEDALGPQRTPKPHS